MQLRSSVDSIRDSTRTKFDAVKQVEVAFTLVPGIDTIKGLQLSSSSNRCATAISFSGLQIWHNPRPKFSARACYTRAHER